MHVGSESKDGGWAIKKNDETHSRRKLESRYEEILEEFGPALHRLASSYESLPQPREDLMQDIRMAIWIALPKFEARSSMRTFIFRIAHNRALNHVWRRKRIGITEPLDGLELPDAGKGPDASSMAEASCDRLLRAIQELPLAMKQVMTLALEDVSHAEIAAVLGLSENNVAVRLNRARAMLREKLRDEL